MVNIDNFYRKYGNQDGIDYPTLRKMTESGLIQIMDEQTVFTMDEVANIVNKTKRTVNYWVDSGKMKVIDDVDFSRVVTAAELKRLMSELPIKKNHKCIYLKVGKIEEARELIKYIVSKYGVDQYRGRVFIDIDGNEAVGDLINYALKFKELQIYTNVPLRNRCEYLPAILDATYSNEIVIK